LGRKYFADIYIDQIGSEDYRRVLIAMADHMDEWVGRQTIISGSGVKESIVNNALSGMRDHEANIDFPRDPLPSGLKPEKRKKAEPALSVGDTSSVINVLEKPGGSEG
jgi:hypothetical protein